MSYPPPSAPEQTPPGAMPPYGYAPIPAAPTSGAAMASFVLGIVCHLPGWLATLIQVPLIRSGNSAARVGALYSGIAIVSAIIAIGAVICGHIALGRVRAFGGRGLVAAVVGLTLGYSRIAGVLISLISTALIGALYR